MKYMCYDSVSDVYGIGDSTDEAFREFREKIGDKDNLLPNHCEWFELRPIRIKMKIEVMPD